MPGGVRFISSPVVRRKSTYEVNSNGESVTKREAYSQESPVSGPKEVSSGLPQLVRHEESTTIELFYDLFFVANLTTFTTVHEVNSKKALTSYIGFFCVLWFTWCETSLFDVRFMSDSWLQRLAKACHLGIMVGLSIVGPNYDTQDDALKQAAETDGSKSLKTLGKYPLSKLLHNMLTHTSLHLDGLKNHSRIPISPDCVSAALLPEDQIADFTTGCWQLCCSHYLYHHRLVRRFFTYQWTGLGNIANDYSALNKHEHAYRAFYVIAAFEMVYLIVISSLWKVCSFKGTHLVERMSLLTLYICKDNRHD